MAAGRNPVRQMKKPAAEIAAGLKGERSDVTEYECQYSRRYA